MFYGHRERRDNFVLLRFLNPVLKIVVLRLSSGIDLSQIKGALYFGALRLTVCKAETNLAPPPDSLSELDLI